MGREAAEGVRSTKMHTMWPFLLLHSPRTLANVTTEPKEVTFSSASVSQFCLSVY